MIKKTNAILVLFILMSCVQSKDQETNAIIDTDSLENTSADVISNSSTIQDDWTAVTLDTSELKEFWSSVTLPILSGDKATVLSNIDFPIRGNMQEYLLSRMNKSHRELTKSDFDEFYDKFFSKHFLESIKSQTYRDAIVGKSRDTIWCSITLSRALGMTEGGLMLGYFKQNGQYKLKTIDGAGADFFYEEKQESSGKDSNVHSSSDTLSIE